MMSPLLSLVLLLLLLLLLLLEGGGEFDLFDEPWNKISTSRSHTRGQTPLFELSVAPAIDELGGKEARALAQREHDFCRF